jgi:hypothetical protein
MIPSIPTGREIDDAAAFLKITPAELKSLIAEVNTASTAPEKLESTKKVVKAVLPKLMTRIGEITQADVLAFLRTSANSNGVVAPEKLLNLLVDVFLAIQSRFRKARLFEEAKLHTLIDKAFEAIEKDDGWILADEIDWESLDLAGMIEDVFRKLNEIVDSLPIDPKDKREMRAGIREEKPKLLKGLNQFVDSLDKMKNRSGTSAAAGTNVSVSAAVAAKRATAISSMRKASAAMAKGDAFPAWAIGLIIGGSVLVAVLIGVGIWLCLRNRS